MIVQGDATGSPPVTNLVASTLAVRGAIGLSQFSARETGITTPQRRLLGGEVTQSPGRVGAAEKLCEKRKSIEKFMREEKEHRTVAGQAK